MAVQVYDESDVIDVQFVPVLIFGPPGSGKTTISQTAEGPTLTLDFDKGAHRAFNRKKVVRFDQWADVLTFQRGGGFDGAKTLVVDTIGRALDCMVPAVKDMTAANRGPGGLSPKGYGVLGSMFADWIKTVRDSGKQLVLLAHEKETESPGGQTVVKPDLPGKMAWSELHKWTDLIGYLRYEERRKFLDFNPSEVAPCCKNAGGFEPIPVPRLEQSPDFLAGVIQAARDVIGRTAQRSAELAKVEREWADWLASDPSYDEFCERVPKVGGLTNGAKRRVWDMVSAHAAKCGLVFDQGQKKFVAKGGGS